MIYTMRKDSETITLTSEAHRDAYLASGWKEISTPDEFPMNKPEEAKEEETPVVKRGRKKSV